MKLKVCGMKYQDNMKAVAELKPDYLGFIFYEKSARNFEGPIAKLPDTIKKTGVFVDASIAFVLEKVTTYNFDAIQLHGNESPDYCNQLKEQLTKDIEIIKVFSIKDTFDFEELTPYEGIVDYFLFDTKGKKVGGNGYAFDWSVLKEYTSTTPFILSGGIGLLEVTTIKEILKSKLPIYAIDVNSKFEIQPGLKNTDDLKKFMSLLSIS